MKRKKIVATVGSLDTRSFLLVNSRELCSRSANNVRDFVMGFHGVSRLKKRYRGHDGCERTRHEMQDRRSRSSRKRESSQSFESRITSPPSRPPYLVQPHGVTPRLSSREKFPWSFPWSICRRESWNHFVRSKTIWTIFHRPPTCMYLYIRECGFKIL